MDWFSRYVLSWKLSDTREGRFCVEALEAALKRAAPRIGNTDQGVQFTSQDWLECLEELDIQISMDGRGHFWDNILVGRLWRSVKYELVYLQDWSRRAQAHQAFSRYFRFYHEERLHQSLANLPPAAVYFRDATNKPRKGKPGP